ncbi:Neutral ceramidase precursor [Fuerstiella marisgermanici]|uniref:Neutral ceramidase n=2 Tax=Fuerstiella marisgermanici TaxID=1891926 RepID=A0A1P8WGM0_9PLAN|nr:Neutral ceramidase precursor [Fuerstiella marisgermanici]
MTRSLSAALLFSLLTNFAVADNATWKAGTAKANITPEQPLWMAGYGGRDKPAEGTYHDLWIRVVALEDANGHQGIVLSSDTLGIPQSIYNNTCAALKEKFGLDRSQIMLHSSHTHTGPVLRGALYDIYPLDDEQRQMIEAYSDDLEKKIVATIGEALAKLVPAKVSGGQGIATFAVNRRNNVEGEVPKLRETDGLQGPIDHDVPVLSVRSMDNELMAVVFGYACHNTNLSFYQWSGDYAGFAQYALEDVHPNAVAMFYMGCGADQNPIPRRTVELAKGYGLRLAAAVERVLAEPMQEFTPSLQTEHEFVTLNLGKEPTREELATMAGAGSSYVNRWAARLLKDVEAGKPLEHTYPYPLQAWKLGEKQKWITMGGEVVVDYALGFKKSYGDDTWVASYCNDVMAYIPSLRVLDEDIPPRKSARWGYEGNRSMMVYGRAAHRWADDIEELVADTVERLMERLKTKKQKPEPVSK